MQTNWASSLFKGRIGEAVVESVLSEFGYQVDRSGQEFHRLPAQSGLAQEVLAPDLAVTDPKTGSTKYVEVKFRSARPMSVILEKARLEDIRRYYPGTILIFVSAYNGSVNCANVDEISEDNYKVTPDGFAEFDLTRRGWRPIWDFFPLVQPGERLKQLWTELKAALHNFGEFQMSRGDNEQALEDEREFLETYIEEYWKPGMELDIQVGPPEEDSTINELWKIARSVNAIHFAVDLHDPNDEIEIFDLYYIVNRLLGKSGESQGSIDLEALRKELLAYPDLLSCFDDIRSQAGGDDPIINQMLSRRMVDEVFHFIPKGVGKAYLGTNQHSLEDALEIDLRTFISLAERRNRLDQDT